MQLKKWAKRILFGPDLWAAILSLVALYFLAPSKGIYKVNQTGVLVVGMLQAGVTYAANDYLKSSFTVLSVEAPRNMGDVIGEASIAAFSSQIFVYLSPLILLAAGVLGRFHFYAGMAYIFITIYGWTGWWLAVRFVNKWLYLFMSMEEEI